MNAKTARQLAFNSIDLEIQEIQNFITESAKNGNMCIVAVSLSQAAHQYLIDEGYSVEMITVSYKTSYKISW